MSAGCIEIIEGRPEDARAVIDFTKKAGSETDNLTFGAEGLEVTLEEESVFLRKKELNKDS